MDLILTRPPVTADEALRVGLVNRVAPAASLMAEAHAFAWRSRPNAPMALRRSAMQPTIQATWLVETADSTRRSSWKRRSFGLVASATESAKEGTARGPRKRKAVFEGEHRALKREPGAPGSRGSLDTGKLTDCA